MNYLKKQQNNRKEKGFGGDRLTNNNLKETFFFLALSGKIWYLTSMITLGRGRYGMSHRSYVTNGHLDPQCTYLMADSHGAVFDAYGCSAKN